MQRWSRLFDLTNRDIVRNLLGFIPFGVCFAAYLAFKTRLARRRIFLLTVVAGGAISLTIELLQGFLPSRDSSMEDLICNIVSSAAGALLFIGLYRILPGLLEKARKPRTADSR